MLLLSFFGKGTEVARLDSCEFRGSLTTLRFGALVKYGFKNHRLFEQTWYVFFFFFFVGTTTK